MILVDTVFLCSLRCGCFQNYVVLAVGSLFGDSMRVEVFQCLFKNVVEESCDCFA